jgi:hypothetical protein
MRSANTPFRRRFETPRLELRAQPEGNAPLVSARERRERTAPRVGLRGRRRHRLRTLGRETRQDLDKLLNQHRTRRHQTGWCRVRAGSFSGVGTRAKYERQTLTSRASEVGAGGGIRTPNPLPGAVFETAAYTVPPHRLVRFRGESRCSIAVASEPRQGGGRRARCWRSACPPLPRGASRASRASGRRILAGQRD